MTGSGTLLDPYVIYNVDDLKAIELGTFDPTAYYIVNNDIDCAGVPVSMDFGGHFDGKGFSIYNLTSPLFNDIWNWAGISPVVQNLHVSGSIITGHDLDVGGFVIGVYDDAQIINCSADVDITSVGACTTYAGNTIGGFAATTGGTCILRNCHASGNIIAEGAGTYGGFLGYSCEDETFEDCYAEGSITVSITNEGHPFEIGGFVGFSCWNEHYTNCYATGNVSGVLSGVCRDFTIGGFLAFSCCNEHFSKCYATGNVSTTNNGTLQFSPESGGFAGFLCSDELYEMCYATGDVTVVDAHVNTNYDTPSGGFVGMWWGDDAITRNCYSRGDVSATGDGLYVGGFAGWAYRSQNYTGKIENCYSTGHVSSVGAGNIENGFTGDHASPTNVPDVIGCFWDTQTSGQAASALGAGKTTAQMKTKATFTAAGWDFVTIWDIDGVTNDGYPFFLISLGIARSMVLNIF